MKRLPLLLPDEQAEQVRDVAFKNRQPKTDLIRDAITIYFAVMADPTLREWGKGVLEKED